MRSTTGGHTPSYNIEGLWVLFRDSKKGHEARERFESFNCEELVFFYNPILSKHIHPNLLDEESETIFCYGFSDLDVPTTKKKALECLFEIASFGICENNQWITQPLEYDILVSLMLPFSYAAFKFAPDFFYPYLYGLRFSDFVEAVTILGYTIPPIPKRHDYKARYEYYWVFCKIFTDIRDEYKLSYIETCVFIYDFIPYIINKESINLPKPTQCWFIGGLFTPTEGRVNETFWQVNKDTDIGDIMVHYETSPKSSVTTIWRALSKGYEDPFFHYHICGRIGERINITSITLAELKQDEYFSTFPLTRKNFQGVNGFPMPAEAYNRLLEIIASKGGDVSSLPKLYAPILKSDTSIKIEKDVEERLIIPLLESLGLQSGRDYKRQMGIHMGTGHRVIPDFVVHYKDIDGEEEARILIEAKYEMNNRKDIDSAFKQARSYALNLKAEYLVTCDKSKLLMYTKTHGDFHKDKYTCLSWTDIENPDTFNMLKKVFL